jgi:hypothetical protein
LAQYLHHLAWHAIGNFLSETRNFFFMWIWIEGCLLMGYFFVTFENRFVPAIIEFVTKGVQLPLGV